MKVKLLKSIRQRHKYLFDDPEYISGGPVLLDIKSKKEVKIFERRIDSVNALIRVMIDRTFYWGFYKKLYFSRLVKRNKRKEIKSYNFYLSKVNNINSSHKQESC